MENTVDNIFIEEKVEEEQHSCGVCSCEYESGDLVEFEGKFLCEGCIDEQTDFCSKCDERHWNDDLTEFDDELLCSECYDKFTAICSECKERYLRDDLTEFDGSLLCEDCLDDCTFICSDCGNRESIESGYYYGDNHICMYCYDYNYYTCAGCGIVIHRDDACYDEDDDDSDPYCEGCFAERENTNLIRGNGYKPEPIFYGTGIFYGVELEIDKGGRDNQNAERLMNVGNACREHIYIKHDGSLYDGLEIVSHPMSLEYHITGMPWESIMSEAIQLGYKSHNCPTCGLHIHVGRNELGDSKEEQDDTIGRIVYFIEKQWENLIVFSRRTETQINQWAARYHCTGNPKAALKSAKESNLGRYVCLNLYNHDTIEFRIFRGTLKYSTFLATLQLVDEICQTAKSLTDEEFELMEWSDFVRRIPPDKKELINYLKDKQLFKEVV